MVKGKFGKTTKVLKYYETDCRFSVTDPFQVNVLFLYPDLSCYLMTKLLFGDGLQYTLRKSENCKTTELIRTTNLSKTILMTTCACFVRY